MNELLLNGDATEQVLSERLTHFLLMRRTGFALVGGPYPIKIGGRSDFVLDLLFYHLELRCYLVVDIRGAPFQPEFASMLNLYLATVDEQLRPPPDPPSVGLLVCQSTSAVSVKYILRDYDQPIGVSGYHICAELPDRLQPALPTPAAIEAALHAARTGPITKGPYIEAFAVRLYDLDAWNHLRSSTLMRYMEQTATNLTTTTGFGATWYEARGTAFVMRSFRLQRFNPATTGNVLTVTAWVSNTQRVRLCLDFEVRQPDDQPVAVGRAEWVYIDRHSRRPQALDPAMLMAWPSGAPSPLWTAPLVLPDQDPREPDTLTQPVYCYDAEALGVTNFAVYPIWLEEAAGQALRAWRYPVELPHPGSAQTWLDLRTLAIHYLGPTRPGETVTIITQHTGADPAHHLVAVAQEIRGADGEVRLRADTLYHIRRKEG
jgi:acyl-CoA thioesterase FadM